MNAIYSNNPNAFVDKNINKIKAGAELSIPSIATVVQASEQNIVEQETSPNIKPLVDSGTKTNKLTESLPSQKEIKKSASLKVDQYRVEKGDTLSYIAKNIGYKEVPFAKMLKAIYIHNPNAFVDGNITKLSVGSIITLPSLSDFKTSPNQLSSDINVKKPIEVKKLGATAPIVLNNKKAVPNDLIRRIRELRKELKQSKDSLSEIKKRLNQKEIILQQKDIQLDSLNATLTKLGENATPGLVATAGTAVKQVTAKTRSAQKKDNRAKSKAEIAKLKRDFLVKQEKTNKQLEKINELKDKTLSPNKTLLNKTNEGMFKNYAVSSIVSFTKTNYSYLTIALLLSLLLVRYRRELYRYTYSTINYDQPTYYPIPDADKYELKERNINYHDPKMDEDVTNYEFLTDKPVEQKVVINPLLVDATQDIFAEDEDAKHIEHCEHLVTELFDDLAANEDTENSAEWQNIEEVCDNYIEKIKDTDIAMAANENGVLVEEATDFNHMMSDLLESLDKVDKSVKRNNIADEDFPDLFESTQAEFTEDRNQA